MCLISQFRQWTVQQPPRRLHPSAAVLQPTSCLTHVHTNYDFLYGIKHLLTSNCCLIGCLVLCVSLLIIPCDLCEWIFCYLVSGSVNQTDDDRLHWSHLNRLEKRFLTFSWRPFFMSTLTALWRQCWLVGTVWGDSSLLPGDKQQPCRASVYQLTFIFSAELRKKITLFCLGPLMLKEMLFIPHSSDPNSAGPHRKSLKHSVFLTQTSSGSENHVISSSCFLESQCHQNKCADINRQVLSMLTDTKKLPVILSHRFHGNSDIQSCVTRLTHNWWMRSGSPTGVNQTHTVKLNWWHLVWNWFTSGSECENLV